MIAQLGMYDRPGTTEANDHFYSIFRKALGRGPEALDRTTPLWDGWRSPDLLLSQTCGLPYREELHEITHLIGAPDYRNPGCPPGYYNSVIVVRADAKGQRLEDFHGQRLAYNEPESQSGWGAITTYAAARDVRFGEHIGTGAHVNSARAVHDGRADVACIDVLSWRLMRRYDAYTENLREIGRTEPTPATPYLTGRQNDPEEIAAALETAIAQMGAETADILSIYGLARVPHDAYMALPVPPKP